MPQSNRLPYHVTARANNRETFKLSMPQMWKIVGEECHRIYWNYGVEFQAVVLMPNHIHLILTVPECPLGKAMNEFLKSVSRRMNQATGRTGHVFGERYYGSLITSSRYFGHALKYVYRNPVKAELCERVENYPYSSLQSIFGLQPPLFALNQTRVGLEVATPDLEEPLHLAWLNQCFPNESEKIIQSGLRKRIFGDLRNRRTRRPFEELNELL